MNAQTAFSLEGCNALLTGAAGRLGRAMCHALGTAGARLEIAGRDAMRLEALTQELADAGITAHPLLFDLGNTQARRRATAELVDRITHLDILINNAHGGRPGRPDQTTEQDFDQAHRLAVNGPHDLIQRLLPLLETAARRRPGGASIINIASMYGMVSPDPAIYGDSGMNSPPYYAAAKAGMIQLSRYLAVHLASRGIRVNSISPGPFPPASLAGERPDFHAALCAKTPLGRIGEPQELAGPIVFLASAASSYVTGVNLPVDGGWTAW